MSPLHLHFLTFFWAAAVVSPSPLNNQGADERANLANYIQWAANNISHITTPTEPPTSPAVPPTTFNEQPTTFTKQPTTFTEQPTTPTTIPQPLYQPTTPSPPAESKEAIVIVQEESPDVTAPQKETIYVIRQPVSGSVVGIIKEALGLVHNTLTFVGFNLLAGPLLGAQALNQNTALALSRLNASYPNANIKIIGRTDAYP